MTDSSRHVWRWIATRWMADIGVKSIDQPAASPLCSSVAAMRCPETAERRSSAKQ